MTGYELADLLETYPEQAAAATAVEAIPASTIPAKLPSHIVRMLDEPAVVGTRSERTAALVLAGLEAGLFDGEIVATGRAHAPTREKYGRRLEREVGRLIHKHRPAHAHPGTPCDRAACPNTPTWMTSHPVAVVRPHHHDGETPHPVEMALPDETKGRRPLDVISVGELAEQVGSQPSPRWLARPVWPEDAYGIIGAEDKAGKTWMMLDLAVSVASGTPWLGRFDCEPGPVLMFLGEGGPRKMYRRLCAVAGGRGVELAELPIRLCMRVPHLTSAEHLQIVDAELASHPARLIGLDPLYLAARGARGSDLYEMGSHLEAVQDLAQHARAALVVSHHYNKTGEGRGPSRYTGVGPGAWGRVLCSADLRHRRITDETTRETLAVLDVAFVGDEIGDIEVTLRRRVWAFDPDDLASPMGYEVEVADADGDRGSGELRPSERRVLEVLRAETDPAGVRRIGDVLADGDDGPLKRRTIQNALQVLERLGLACRDGEDVFGGHLWARAEEAENAL